MIPNQWYVLMESKQVRDKPVGVTRMGEKLVFWRDGTGKVSCLRDKCPHRGVELSKGQGDRPIVEYRRRREQLVAAAREGAEG